MDVTWHILCDVTKSTSQTIIGCVTQRQMDAPDSTKKVTKNTMKSLTGASKGEDRIDKLLKGMDIIYESQKSFTQCKDKRCLPFDFMIVVNGRVAVIEYDGRQHFEIVKEFHKGDPIDSKEAFDKGHRHDITKNMFTIKYNISLLRISHKEDEHIEKWVVDFIEALRKSNKRVEMFSNLILYSEPYGHHSDKDACLIM